MIGERFDADAGLQFLNARYYDPKLAMFIQPDWWEVMQAGVGVNRYGYCSNDPTNCTDPSGHQDMPDISTDEDKEHFESCAAAGGCTSKLSYGEEMSNVCEAGGCAIGAIAITGGATIVAEAGLGVVSTAAAMMLAHEEILAASDGLPVSLGRSVGAGKAVSVGAELAADTASVVTSSAVSATTKVHKNSLSYVGETHVYAIRGETGGAFKIGESAQGTRLLDGASRRAEQQARKLANETGQSFETEIRKVFDTKTAARSYETRMIETYRRLFGADGLSGNKTNR